jgi:hypothetical protein
MHCAHNSGSAHTRTQRTTYTRHTTWLKNWADLHNYAWCELLLEARLGGGGRLGEGLWVLQPTARAAGRLLSPPTLLLYEWPNSWENLGHELMKCQMGFGRRR